MSRVHPAVVDSCAIVDYAHWLCSSQEGLGGARSSYYHAAMRILLLPLAALTLTAAGPINPERIKADVRTLSSDAFAGRGPGEKGEAATIDYLAKQMEAAGLAPGGEDGGWFQKVPLVRLDTAPGGTATIRAGDNATVLRDGPDLDINPTNAGVTSLSDVPLVFAGWGAPDPARGWDAFQGVDVKGKVVIMLAGDPDLEGSKDLGFGGRSLAFSGRGGTKAAAAAKAGAIGVLFIHEAAAYSWPYAQAGNSIRVPSFAYAPLKPNALQFSGISKWLAGSSGRLKIDYTGQNAVGISVARGANGAVDVSSTRLILVRDANMPTGYRIQTGFPKKP